jgi:RNA polymerase sigma factor (TIGR02999 family)
MKEVTRILSAVEQGDRQAAEDLLPLVYDELRKLAAQKLAHERPGQTLQATALVHEAYLRLVKDKRPQWEKRRHFFGAAAKAMRDILVEKARRKKAQKHGGKLVRHDVANITLPSPKLDEELLALDEALTSLAAEEPRKAQLVELHHFGGLTFEECTRILNISLTTAKRDWSFARAWLHQKIKSDNAEKSIHPKAKKK